MAADSQETHRPGPYKQKNKPHKHGKHKSKGALERETKGKVSVKSLSKKAKIVQSKTDRRYLAQILRKQKREEVLAKKRSRGSSGTPPHFVAVVPLDKSVDVKSILELLQKSDDTADSKWNDQEICHIALPRFKQRIEVCAPEYGNLNALLDAAKVADSMLFVYSATNGLDDLGEYFLSCLFGQGLPAFTLVIQGLKSLPQKKQGEAKKAIHKVIETRFPGEKVHSLDSTQDALVILRQITGQKLKPIYYRENRPHLMAEGISFELDNAESEHGTLQLTGYLRGQTLSVNRLVHLPGWGEFQMSKVEVLDDPYPLILRSDKQKRNEGSQDAEMMSDDLVAKAIQTEVPDPGRQESLETEVVPDPMEGEQTWPTEEELAEAESEAKGKKKVRKVPKGTSEYQAAWILDSDGESQDDEDEDVDADVDAEMEAVDEEESEEEEKEDYDDEFEDVSVVDDDAKYDETIDMNEEMSMLEKIKEERMHVMFPDEIDTPKDTTARTRFQKYRGLQSYRTSPWDSKENLPLDYARIFKFANFRRTARRMLNEDNIEDGGIMAWSYIRIHVKDVPKEFMETYRPGTPVVLFGLLPHEQKMSVVNYIIQKTPEINRPIKSKERLIFHVGFRRFSANPIFSQHTNATKHKFERFLPQEGAAVATMYSPITFPPAPILVFQERAFGRQELVARGSLMSVDPDRIITKRVVLSGYPYKINKKSVVIRYMFFNREDIEWFKPVELRTKWGRRGHIKEPLGTHGHMKCVLDGQMKSQDTVLMNLYKRVYPRWVYSPRVPNPPVVKLHVVDKMEAIAEGEETVTEKGAAFKLFD